MGVLNTVYDRSPYWLQHLMLNYYALKVHRERYGSDFAQILKELRKTETYSASQILNYQNERFIKLVHHAFDTVPFYQQRYREHGINKQDIKDLRDSIKLPLLTRDDVRTNGHALLSSAFSEKDLVHGHTSGTTGSPLNFNWDKQTCVYTAAVDWRQKAWAGINYKDPIALFLGRTIVSTRRTQPPFWQLDRLHNMLWMSSFHLSEQFLPSYFEKLKVFEPRAVEGYPSTIYILARYLQSIDQTFPVNAVFTSSETLLPIQRSLIEERFNAPVFDFFGMAERVLFATQCAEAHAYHLNFEYAYNEVVDGAGVLLPFGQEGYLVGTSLVNYGMPFIRYKTTDISAMSDGVCSCGRMMPRLQAVTTKDEDIVVTPEGKLVSSSVLTHPFKPLDAVRESQIIQESIDTLLIKIVRRPEYTDADTQQLLDSLRERVGSSMKITVEFVETIPRSPSGKLRWVISKVPLPL